MIDGPSEQPMGEDLHWLAGLLEGEGSFYPGPPSNPRMPVISLQMTDEDIVLRVARLFGRASFRYEPRRSKWQATYQVRVTGSKAVRWMERLRPLMGERRTAQIDRALACYAPRSNVILEEADAREALELLAAGHPVKAVADRFGTSVWCMYDLRLGRTHKHLDRHQP